MIPGRIFGATNKLERPEGQSPSDCGSLHVKAEVVDGRRYMTSAWFPSVDELTALHAGAPVYLVVCAPQHPVVAVRVGPAPDA